MASGKITPNRRYVRVDKDANYNISAKYETDGTYLYLKFYINDTQIISFRTGNYVPNA